MTHYYTNHSENMSEKVHWTDIALAGVRNSGTGNGTRVNNSSTTQLAIQINGGVSVVTDNYTNKLYSVVRLASNSTKLYEDGVEIGTAATVSTGLESLSLYILALNNNGAALGFTDAKIGFVLVGSKDISVTNLTTRWNTYQAAIA